MKALSIENLHKSFPNVKAVDGVSFSIEQGDFFGFLGPNGAGKTTTINCIVGLANFSLGGIKVFGKDIEKNYREARKLIGLSPQEYNFDPYLKIEEVLIYQAGYYGIRKRDVMPRVEELLKQFKLEGKSEVDFRKLSGGMKRRLSIARALVHNPKLLILDEPTAGVDVELRLELHEYLKKINKEGTTILLTSHYIEEIEKLCNKVAIINDGKLIANDKKEKLMQELDTGHTEILLNKKIKPMHMNHVEFIDNKIIIGNKGKDKIKDLFKYIQSQRALVENVRTVKDSLQDIFLRLTKK
ncbi:MAG: ABC transporter ATP-binding protein [Nanoarchaeota archaeon]